MKAIVTADDFGFSKNINRACIEALEIGSITELSLMVDAFATKEAITYSNRNNVKNIGLHFSLMRASKNEKALRSKDYAEILETKPQKELIIMFDDEVKMFEDLLGFSPQHIIGHQQIALHPKLIDHVAEYCVTNNCYCRKNVEHETLQNAAEMEEIDLGRTVDKITGFHYGTPEEMYKSYSKDIQQFKLENIQSVEIIFHPGYAGEFEKPHTSFIQERIDDINFLKSEYFKKLVKEEKLELVDSSEV